jgi:hypothetical protein
MTNNISDILHDSVLLFNSDELYAKFQTCILNGKFQAARFYLDNEIENQKQFDQPIIHHDLYDTIDNMLMDLIINEIDGEKERNEPINKNTR